MLSITFLEECNICFENFTNDKLTVCKNKQCKFKMCTSCSSTYLQNNNKCAHCKIVLKEDKYKSKFNVNKYNVFYFIIYMIVMYFLGYLITRKFYGAYILLNIFIGCTFVVFIRSICIICIFTLQN